MISLGRLCSIVETRYGKISNLKTNTETGVSLIIVRKKKLIITFKQNSLCIRNFA